MILNGNFKVKLHIGNHNTDIKPTGVENLKIEQETAKVYFDDVHNVWH